MTWAPTTFGLQLQAGIGYTIGRSRDRAAAASNGRYIAVLARSTALG